MIFSRFLFSIFFLFCLAGCNNDDSNPPSSYSEHGLPEAQKAQGDNPAGVKFGQENAFKPLSEPRDQP